MLKEKKNNNHEKKKRKTEKIFITFKLDTRKNNSNDEESSKQEQIVWEFCEGGLQETAGQPKGRNDTEKFDPAIGEHDRLGSRIVL